MAPYCGRRGVGFPHSAYQARIPFFFLLYGFKNKNSQYFLLQIEITTLPQVNIDRLYAGNFNMVGYFKVRDYGEC